MEDIFKFLLARRLKRSTCPGKGGHLATLTQGVTMAHQGFRAWPEKSTKAALEYMTFQAISWSQEILRSQKGYKEGPFGFPSLPAEQCYVSPGDTTGEI